MINTRQNKKLKDNLIYFKHCFSHLIQLHDDDEKDFSPLFQLKFTNNREREMK